MPDDDTGCTGSNNRPPSSFVDADPPNDEAFDSPDNQDDTPPDTGFRIPGHTLTTTGARREIKASLCTAKDAMEPLQRIKAGKTASLTDVAVDCLVCAATDRRYPLDDEDEWVASWRQKARDKRLDRYVELALDELDDIHLTYEAALSSLKLISLLDARLEDSWGNLPVIELARKINFKGHELMRGRVPGVSL